ncbi:MAG: dihydropteroate synthase [Candidatus Nitronauta litoralis]|uniref:Methionine synthase n=1 Tax=Candidatus Nitronauta litoralis TaxID=2705533 RepID=A0A7T0FZG5_9BACT|nr:MAG: dihydropteroate synthase [Candidatus Nitronauta litoralis]
MNFEQALKERILILDGAMGTMVQNLEVTDATFGGSLFRMLTDLLTFARPDDLKGIHRAYLDAGANILETNTFGASPLRLREFDWAHFDPADLQSIPDGLDLRKGELAEITRHINAQACQIAQQAVEEYKASPDYDGRPLFVAGSMGPSNCVLSSTEANLTRTTWDEVVENNRLQVAGLLEGGADLLLIETQQDILETKATLVGARRAFKEAGRSIPIQVQVTVDVFSKMQIFNTDILAAYTTVAPMKPTVFGINCNVGPEEMLKSVEILSRYSSIPFSIVPNAGQPISEDGKTCYKLEPEAMAEIMEPFASKYGAAVLGGCCGTSPAHIRCLADMVRGLSPVERQAEPGVWISGPQNAIPLDSSKNLIRIGERLNVRGSKKVREAVEREGDMIFEDLESVTHEQVDDLGIEVIDVCMDSNIVETEKVLPQVIYHLTSDFKGAMCLDSFSVEALVKGLESYPGRPILNSISLEDYEEGVSKLDAVLSKTAEHHPLYIALVNGPKGPAITRQEKYDLAKEIVERSQNDYEVGPDELIIDVNAYPIGSESEEGVNFALESLESIPMIKAIHPDLKTSIGVGNLTNGLAQKPYMRMVLTSVFLHEGRERGLDCAILNPNHYVPVESLTESDVALARKVILERDMAAFEELEEIALRKKTGKVQKKQNYDDLDLEARICRKIMDGFKQKQQGVVEREGWTYEYKDKIVTEAAKVLDRHEPLDFVGNHLMKTMRELGDRFGRGEVSLPHLLKSADVMRHVMGFLEAWMRHLSGAEPGSVIDYKGTVVIGTVFQDVHSIGKDLAKTLLDNYGYRTIDLGVQVPLEQFIETARQEKADAIGMSALLVQTSNHMITVSRMLEEQMFDIPVLIGGAPVNDRHAGYVAMFGQASIDRLRPNVFYCESGMDGVNTMNALMNPGQRDSLLEKNREDLVRHYQRAKGLAEDKKKLFESLPRRQVDLKKYQAPSDGVGFHKIEFRLEKLKPEMDTKSLFSLNWKFGKQSSWKTKGVELEDLKKLQEDWIKKADENQWICPQARFALLPAQSEGDELIVYDPKDLSRVLGRFSWTVCLGRGKKGKQDTFSVAQYFHSRESGLMDMVGVQITTAGSNLEGAVRRFKEDSDTESALYLQGLGDRVAEDLAEYCHQLQKQRIGRAKSKDGQRYSPGYPAIENLVNNKVLFEILKPEDLGISLTDANEFDPPSTTGAIICFHPEAGYS